MISVIIPVLNEEDGVCSVIKGVPKKIDGEHVEVIVVDGGSTDSTLEKAKSTNARVIIEKRRGKGIGMRTGVKYARGDKIVFIDGDGEYDPKYIPYMIELLDNCNEVKGYCIYTVKDYGFGGKILAMIIRALTYRPFFKDMGTLDPLNGLRAFKKEDWEKLDLKSKNFLIEAEIEMKAIKNGFKIIEFPIVRKRRAGGRTKYLFSFKDMFNTYRLIRENKTILKGPKNIVTIKEHRY